MNRISLQAKGWVHIRYLRSIAKKFTRLLEYHVSEKHVEHYQLQEGEKWTNYYRLTRKGRAWVKLKGDNYAKRAFKPTLAVKLQTKRHDKLQNGWNPAAPELYCTHRELGLSLGLLKQKYIRPNNKRILYVKLTPKGNAYMIAHLKKESAAMVKDRIKEFKKTGKEAQELRKSARETLEENIANLTAYGFAFACRDTSGFSDTLAQLLKAKA